VLLNHQANYSSPRKYCKKQRTSQIKIASIQNLIQTLILLKVFYVLMHIKVYITAIPGGTEH
jgi:hypothetical protein